ncbi:uncharacterized protein K441DRAFT_671661 [Cenococcum geophilum 1.58]|uniref:Uncharacterized protein n=1 Tax=Cenococcum geophilum 1.58 TaxID=794803 RepID=A0ACC8EKR9_9PEZI|nr:hypothetical protein K441DRAFT_671661 [Cenococcum geophilum 1.58]
MDVATPARQSSCNSLEECPSSITAIVSKYITLGEEKEIRRQFESRTWCPGSLVPRSGIPRHTAEEWAAKRGRQTLALAMGPLMDRTD